MNSSEQRRAAIPGRPKADYQSAGAGDPLGRSESGTNPSVRDHVERLLRQGLSNKEIAGQVGMCEPTLKNYIRAIYADRGASTAREYFASLLQSKD